MRLKVLNVADIARYQLCCGCGACAYADPDGIEMIDSLEFGRRPRQRSSRRHDGRAGDAMAVCPGIGVARTADRAAPGLIRELFDGWGHSEKTFATNVTNGHE